MEAALVAEGPSLPQSMQRDWGAVGLATTHSGGSEPVSLEQELTAETSRLFQLNQDVALVLLHKSWHRCIRSDLNLSGG